jgi:hypothetical protein
MRHYIMLSSQMHFLHLTRAERELIVIVKYVKCLLAEDFNQTLICSTGFRNNPQHKFHENPPSQGRDFNTETDGQTDKQTGGQTLQS